MENEKIYIWIGVLIVLIVGAVIYWQAQKQPVSSPKQSQEKIENAPVAATSSTSTEQKTQTPTSSADIENLVNELNSDVDQLNSDLSDLQDLATDTSFDTLDSDLSQLEK